MRSDKIVMKRDRVIRLEEMSERYLFALDSTKVPDLNLDEIVVFQNGAWLEAGKRGKDAKLILMEWCSAEKYRRYEDWSLDQQFSMEDPTVSPSPPPPDTSLIDGLTTRIQSWSMLEALKVVRIFEDLDAIALTVVRLSPEAAHLILAQTRAKPMRMPIR